MFQNYEQHGFECIHEKIMDLFQNGHFISQEIVCV